MIRALCLTLAALVFATAALAQDVPRRWTSEWPQTDFTKTVVEFSEIMSGGPPKDGIPAIDTPQIVAATDDALPAQEPVVSLNIGGDARAYPIRYLMWHEIVNDRFGDRPVTITYCPLCNAAIAFDGRLDGAEYDFGVSGKLRHSDMIMYDRQTESWWQQFTGEAIIGEMLGAKLKKIPARLESWAAFRQRFPEGRVMAKPANYLRQYGRNPYAGYDTLDRPWLFDGEEPPHGIPMMARVVVVGDRAWPMSRVVEAGDLTEGGLTLSWRAGQSSALDAERISEGRDVGNLSVVDAAGDDVVHDVTFAFVFHAFQPEGQWMLGG